MGRRAPACPDSTGVAGGRCGGPRGRAGVRPGLRVVQRTPKPLPVTRLVRAHAADQPVVLRGGLRRQTAAGVPLALVVRVDPGRLAFGLPTVKATADTIAGGYSADVPVSVGAAVCRRHRDDPVVVNDRAADALRCEIGRTTIGEGWPFVGWTATRQPTSSSPTASPTPGTGSTRSPPPEAVRRQAHPRPSSRARRQRSRPAGRSCSGPFRRGTRPRRWPDSPASRQRRFHRLPGRRIAGHNDAVRTPGPVRRRGCRIRGRPRAATWAPSRPSTGP